MAAVQGEVRASVLRAAARVASPWKNGGGVTREVAAQRPARRAGDVAASALHDAFLWRVSVADVAAAGPFSRFDGVDRTLVLLDGGGMVLEAAAGAKHVLARPLDVARFAGEASIDARLTNGPTRDFNLMVRRAAVSATLDIWRGPTQRTLDADVVLLYCASGHASVMLDCDRHYALAQDDALRIDAPRALRCTATGAAALIVVQLRLLRDRRDASAEEPNEPNGR
ncbi:HutD/Ves family protein [Paraburkholderia caballeronis]|uniref:HutD family protein n=1 Tax=Paraburkholderia caballeronis TaxID=416943 RepID=A0A1H7U261_9BURK|nr:HutD family protein [Paraburkholderia caballeronis]PXW23475.1 hypothetical protein C7403_110214 [Paraburkholderia caballeronis]PXW98468.1 hypothetical protein C7407_110214 [Paraburkholderia caballeronis]RAJ95199.1 hypothetical protein C7409_110215 [Paraburkholderia caballeronis]SEC51215.1 hypothetical protein SAMN05445871_2346 [Paraburkholderia caballeronis]SEL91182.1 hypothetical protein SAMN05192542_117104 [Paraburkholderia caballeronis]